MSKLYKKETYSVDSEADRRELINRLKLDDVMFCDVEITYRLKIRTLLQNARLHKFFSIMSKSGVKFAEKERSIDEWKQIFVSAHAAATKQDCEIVQGLEGEALQLRESTANMSVARSSSLMEYVTAWAESNRVRLGW